MTVRPAVSIVCSVLDGEPHLPALLDGIGAVMTDDCEVVLLDNGSADATGALFDAWAEERARVTVLHNPVAVGLGEAQATAALAAAGEYLWFIDCDDRFPGDAVSTLLTAATRADADLVVGRAESSDAQGTVLRLLDGGAGPGVLSRSRAVEQVLAGDIEGYTWTKLFRRSLFDEMLHRDGFAPPLLTTQCDFCRVATAVARAERVVVIEDVVYTYVRHGTSMMDRRDQPLGNLVLARDHMVGIAAALLPNDATTRARVAHFTTWFLATSAIQIPFYVRSGSGTKREGRRIAGRAVRGVRPLDVFRLDPLLGFEAVLLRLSPRLYELALMLTRRPTVP